MRAFLIPIALIAANAATAQTCNPPVLTLRDKILTYESPATDVYASGGIAAIADGYVTGNTILIDAGLRTTRSVDLNNVSLTELQVLVGADQIAFRGDIQCRPADPAFVEDLFPDDAPANPNLPEVLFPDDATDSGPRDGLWRAVVGPNRIEGCPKMLAQAFANSGGALAGMTGETRRMAFSRPFDPNQLEMSQTLNARWVQAGPNRWTTEAMPEIFAQIPQGEGGGSRLLWALELASPDLIVFDRTIEIILPDVATAMLGITADGCRVIGTDRWERVGD